MAPRNEELSEDWQVNYPEIQMRSAHLLRSRKWADCMFQFTDKTGAEDSKNTLDAHKLILAMASPVFAAMFYGNVGNTENPVIISDIDLPTFSSLLEYIYTDKVGFADVGAAISLYRAANKYLLIHLEKMCHDYIFQKLHSNNVCQVYEFACFFEVNYLKGKCLEILESDTQQVLKSPSFLNANIHTIKKIVTMDTLNINSDKELYDGLLDYVSNYINADDSQNTAKQPSKIKTESEQNDKQPSNEVDNITEDRKLLENSDSRTSTKNLDGRQILHGIIEQIRFLSMPLQDLVKISESSTVLSDFEIRAIFTNKFQPNSSLLMPDGFSLIREPRHMTEATIYHKVCNVASMKLSHTTFTSPPYYVRNLTWRIIALYEVGGYFSFYLYCNKDRYSTVPENWSCNAKIELRLFSVNSDTKSKWINLEYKYSAKNLTTTGNFGGCKDFMYWNELIDPKNNFIKDDTITLEVEFTTDPVEQDDH